MREVLIERLSKAEQFPHKRTDWVTLLHPGDPGYEHAQHEVKERERRPDGAARANFLYRYFDARELDDLEYEAVRRRMGRYGARITQLLEALWERGMDGDTQAAKEFLNRVLGSPTQRVMFEHHAGDSLERLLKTINPSDAYQRPEVDKFGNEIIEVETSDHYGKEDD